jgi:hypothetical protein
MQRNKNIAPMTLSKFVIEIKVLKKAAVSSQSCGNIKMRGHKSVYRIPSLIATSTAL